MTGFAEQSGMKNNSEHQADTDAYIHTCIYRQVVLEADSQLEPEKVILKRYPPV